MTTQNSRRGRRTFQFGCVALFLAIASSSVTAQEDAVDTVAPVVPVIATVVIETYEVRGSTIEGLEQTLRENALVDSDGRQAVALTTFQFMPDVGYGSFGDQCGVSGAKVAVRATMTLPAWREYRFGRAEERVTWDRFIASLRRHEDQHVAIAERHGARFQEAIATLPPQSTCDALREAVATLQAASIARHRQEQLALDVAYRGGGVGARSVGN